MHPFVKRSGAFLTSATWLDPYGMGNSFNGVAQPYFLVNQETREPNPMRGTLFLALCLLFRAHAIALLLSAASIA
jgi:hypothetical protein